jgi:hypothetical protein
MTHLQTQLTSDVFGEHPIHGQRAFRTETTHDPGRDWQSKSSLPSTQLGFDGAEIVPLTRPEIAAPPLTGVASPPVVFRTAIVGNILERQDQMFLCEVLAGGRALEITLSVELFGWSACPGDAFELSMVGRDGIRQPSVSPRTPDLQVGADLRAEIERLAASMR